MKTILKTNISGHLLDSIRVFLIFISLSFVFHSSFANESCYDPLDESQTFAIVIGISEYKDTKIKLQYADRDAEQFANYLSSKAGGSVPSENIKVLLNKNATVANIYKEMEWIKKQVYAKDKVYFYFAGHGDAENSIHNVGFLLAYDTPKHNYLNNAVRIEDINNMSDHLAVKKKAKVFLITDACHSGSISGKDNVRVQNLAQTQLEEVKKKVTRMASCQANQLSQEDKAWGGGRGAFSFYLINGLTGLADKNQDLKVSFSELENYLVSKVEDDVFDIKEEEQTPVLTSKSSSSVLSNVDKSSLQQLKLNIKNVRASGSSTAGGSRSIGRYVQPLDSFFISLNDSYTETKIVNLNLDDWLDLDPVDFCQFIYANFNDYELGINENWQDDLYYNNKFQELFRNNLASSLHNIVQKIINLYFEIDDKEMLKRLYYTDGATLYLKYAKLCDMALKLLTDHEDPMYDVLRVKYHYFLGVHYRVQAPTTNNLDSIIQLAMTEQETAKSIGLPAAFNINEIGILYRLIDNFSKAEEYFLQASQLAPRWALPYSNLSSVYQQTKKHEEGFAMAKKAIELNDEYAPAYLNLATHSVAHNNLLLAEESSRKAMHLNADYFLPFEQLAYIYITHGNYILADSFFHESEKRKAGYKAAVLNKMDVAPVSDVLDIKKEYCDLVPTAFGSNDHMAFFVYAIENYRSGNFELAEKYFDKCIQVDNQHPLAFRYLAQMQLDNKRYAESEMNFFFAQKCYLDSTQFEAHCRQEIPKQVYLDCGIEERYREEEYFKVEDDYFLTELYKEWGHESDAVKMYEKIIKNHTNSLAPYRKLSNYYRELEQFTNAENVLRRFQKTDYQLGLLELHQFFTELSNKYDKEFDFPFKAGNLAYELATTGNTKIFIDTIYNADYVESSRYVGFKAPEHYHGELPDFAHPFDEVNKEVIPGLEEEVLYAYKIHAPRSKAIYSYKRAVDLTWDSTELYNVYYKIADMYERLDSDFIAADYYKLCINYNPKDESARKSLIRTSDKTWHFMDSSKELLHLQKNKKLDIDNQILLGKYLLLAAKHDEGTELLDKAQDLFPFEREDINMIQGMGHVLSGSLVEAISFQMEQLGTDDQNPNTYYTLARLHAILNDHEVAEIYLGKAIEHGFNGKWILEYDAYLDSIRKRSNWSTFYDQLEFKPMDF